MLCSIGGNKCSFPLIVIVHTLLKQFYLEGSDQLGWYPLQHLLSPPYKFTTDKDLAFVIAYL